MRNSNFNSRPARWFLAALMVVGLAAILYVVSPTLGRALTKNSVSATTGLGGSPGIPGGVPLLW